MMISEYIHDYFRREETIRCLDVGCGDMQIAEQYGNIQSIPTSFVLDKEGRIYSTYVGYMQKDIYQKDIDKLLEE